MSEHAGLAGAILRTARLEAGLSQTELAARAGVAQPVISAYERGRRQPSFAALWDLVAETGVDFDFALAKAKLGSHHPSRTGAHPTTAADAVRDPEISLDDLRPLWQFLDDFGRADLDGRRRLVSEPAPRCGDRVLDALVAGVVEHACVLAGIATPRWALEPDRFLEKFWFGDDPDALGCLMRDTPVSLARRGVFLAGRNLTRV